MKEASLITEILCFVIAAIIFVFGSGSRVYAGIFFTILGVVPIAHARRKIR